MARSARTAAKDSDRGQIAPVIRLPWMRTREAIFFDPDEDMTHQSFRDECDVNRIIDLHTRTGIVTHLAKKSPGYGDVPSMSLHEALSAQAEIRSAIEDGFEFEAQDSPEDGPEAAQEPPEESGGDTPAEPETSAQGRSEAAEA